MAAEEITEREANGFSLADLKRWATRRGYDTAALKLKLSALSKLTGPVIVHLERYNYKHFAVLKGVQGDRVYIADPSRGNIRISVEQFAEDWSGIVLALRPRVSKTASPENQLSIPTDSWPYIEMESARQITNNPR